MNENGHCRIVTNTITNELIHNERYQDLPDLITELENARLLKNTGFNCFAYDIDFILKSIESIPNIMIMRDFIAKYKWELIIIIIYKGKGIIRKIEEKIKLIK